MMRILILVAVLAVCCSAKPNTHGLDRLRELLEHKGLLSSRSFGGQMSEPTFVALAVLTNIELQCEMFIQLSGLTTDNLKWMYKNGAITADMPMVFHVCPPLIVLAEHAKDMDKSDLAGKLTPILEEGLCASMINQIQFRELLVSIGEFDDSNRPSRLVELETTVTARCHQEFGKNEMQTLLNDLHSSQGSGSSNGST